jgi:flagellar hook-basal body complex protein FliE
MAQAIGPISAEARLAQILGGDSIAQTNSASPNAAISPEKVEFSSSPFDDILGKAIDALNSVSQSERYANQMVDKYLRGEAELHKVMIAQSKAGVMVQLAVTTINSAVTTFKEITQMQV